MTIATNAPRSLLVLMLGALFFALCGTAQAQRFERLIDNSTANETGMFGVRPVTTGGYIAVGTKDVVSACGTLTRDVFVVRINNNSTIAWEMTYDLGNACGDDVGMCIIECANGDFAICGNTASAPPACTGVPGANHSFVLRITAAGAFGWLHIYSTTGAWRLIEATMGNGITTFAGDLVFCGSSGAGALLTRVNGANGFVRWDQSYTLFPGGWGGEFKDLVESTAPAGGSLGDIIATGVLDTFATIVRVNGNTGLVGAAPQGIAVYGVGIPYHKLWSVAELQNGLLAGDIVATGYVGVMDIYVVRTAPNPCIVNIDAQHSDLGFINDQAYSIKEILPPPLGPSTLTAGNLIITGMSARRAGTDDDAFLLELNPVGLGVVVPPLGAGFNVYDAGGWGGWDNGQSVSPVYATGAVFPTDGFVICGTSDQNAAIPATALDMYFIKTNAVGSSSCDEGQVGNTQLTPAIAPTCTTVTTVAGLTTCRWGTPPMGNVGSLLLCFAFPKEGMPGEADAGAELAAVSLPNPVSSGAPLRLAILSGEAEPATITVTDVTGKVVATRQTSLSVGETRIELSTSGWASGTYTVTVGAGDRTRTMRVVVVE